MSWFWGNTTAEEAQKIVESLHDELDKKDRLIQALENDLKEQRDWQVKLLEEEVAQLQDRRSSLLEEVEYVEELLKAKQDLLETALKGFSRAEAQILDSTQSPSLPNRIVSEKTEHQAAFHSEEEKQNERQAVDNRIRSPELEIEVGSENEGREGSKRQNEELRKVSAQNKDVAFIIQRSLNDNTVVYAGRRTELGSLDASSPVDVHWIMYMKEGYPREELNMLERNSAYGISVDRDPLGRNGHYQVNITSLTDRSIDFFLDESGMPVAYTTIGGRENMRLERVYVESTTSWGIPKVLYIEIFGVDPNTGEVVYEKKLNR